jgi:hypothetical protein
MATVKLIGRLTTPITTARRARRDAADRVNR